MAEKTLGSEIPWLLRELCVEMGFCLPAAVQGELASSPPRDVDAFTDAVFAAEGLDPSLYKHLRLSVRAKVERRIGRFLAADR
ncbi:MAG TPA: hypothetical protein VMA72_17000 [Streptosporangiaceae bacterium]|nr:hypothetical protein [Streptosporangiaceae bacterium]